ncbi:MAG TPA: methyltransferase domain-containing protein [Geobacteraceae bacterium]
MKRFIAPLLICPACLPKELPLALTVRRETAGDVIDGDLDCRGCRRRFPIRDGLALLTPDPSATAGGSQWRYEEAGTVHSYLWSHFSDLLAAPEANTAYAEWSGQLATLAGPALDAGCAVGRLTFELAARSELAVGCDLSQAFIRTARRLAGERQLSFDLPREGNLRDEFTLTLPDRLPAERTEFVVADALRLPFTRHTFGQAASLNLLDRVSYPLAHLFEMNRVCHPAVSRLLFSSPFAWTSATTPEERWLGGTTTGPYPGRGIDNVRRLLTGQDSLLVPPWRILAEGSVQWRLRSHANHREEIRSLFLAADR